MGTEQIASGGVIDLWNLGQYEDRFQEGDKGELRVNLRWGLPQAMVDGIDSTIRSQGVKLWDKVFQHSSPGSTLVVRFQKGIAPLAIVAIAVAVVGVFLIVGWSLQKITGLSPEWIVLIMVAGIAILAIFMVKEGAVPKVSVG